MNQEKEKKKTLPSSESYSRQIRQHAAEEDWISSSFVITFDPTSLDASASSSPEAGRNLSGLDYPPDQSTYPLAVLSASCSIEQSRKIKSNRVK
jgi:hypothetical protein